MVEASLKGHTLLLQASTPNSRLWVPQQIQWKDINLPEQWQLQAIVPTPKIKNTKPDFIAQKTDGTVIIAFNNNDRQTDILIPIVLQAKWPLWCLPLEAPSPLAHLSLTLDLYLPKFPSSYTRSSHKYPKNPYPDRDSLIITRQILHSLPLMFTNPFISPNLNLILLPT